MKIKKWLDPKYTLQPKGDEHNKMVITPSLYYALKYFCNQSALNYVEGLLEEFWRDHNGYCKFDIDHWEYNGDKYRQKFTYKSEKYDNPLNIKDNYHTDKLYLYIIKSFEEGKV